MTTYVHAFSDGFGSEDKALLGGKGAGLAEMVKLGLPVPPGFTITTEACRHYFRHGSAPAELSGQIGVQLERLEAAAGRRLGDAEDPLLVSVRSGAVFSMPGMMDTVLDIGLNDRSVHGLAARGGERFAFDSYRRLVQMFGETVMGVPDGVYGEALDKLKAERGVVQDVDLDAAALRELVGRFHELTEQHAGRPFPQDPREQLEAAVTAVFESWNGERAVVYRRHEGIPDDLGTAVNVQTMVFGNLGSRSGSGVCFTRDPATGQLGDYGEYLSTAQGEDVVSGVRDAVPLTELKRIDLASYRRLRSLMGTLERHYRDMCDIEFTVEDGHLWILQVRVGKRSAAAAFRIAVDLVDEGTIDLDEALGRVTGAQLAQLMFPRFDARSHGTPLACGLGASPGAAVGRVAFDSATATEMAARGEDVVLVRKETRPDDLPGMVAAHGILTSRGGKTSHAAVVARAMGRPCVCGAAELDVDVEARRITVADGTRIAEGDVISIDGSTGEVFAGSMPVVDSAVVRWFDGEAAEDDVVDAVARLVTHADAVRRLRVRANADTGSDAARAARFGAEGIGLCRTEHMFLGDRRELVERLILADDDEEQDAALAALLPLQRADFAGIFAAMDGKPVTIRLIDPPLHEFLPDLTELAVRVAVDDEHDGASERDRRLLEAVQRLHEENPMLGLRGVRLGIVIPGLFTMQARAAFEAAADHRERGGSAELEIMVPLIASARELELVRPAIDQVATEVAEQRGAPVPYRIGAMIETPRAAVTTDHVVDTAQFLSFGTNDLTQMTWGFSRDDVEVSFFTRYLDGGVFRVSPFESLDVAGVGELVRQSVGLARGARPDVTLGVCGEHGGDPASISFFDAVGLDYVSCSPFRVPVARLEAGRAALTAARATASAGAGV